MPFPFMAAATAAAAGLGFMGQHRANKANQRMAREQMDFQERMSSTAYQRSMEDMRLAGLNPMLAGRLGGASTPGGAQYESKNELEEASNSAKNFVMLKAQLKNMKSQDLSLQAQANMANATALKLAKETELLDMTRGREKFVSSLYDIPGSILSSAKQFSKDFGVRVVPKTADKPGDKYFGPIRIRKKGG